MLISWRTAASIALIALAIFTITLAVSMRARVQRRMAARPMPMHLNDFDHWMNMAPGFLHDHTDYVNDGFPYPPVMLVLMTPLTWLSIPNAHAVWICLKPFLALAVLLLSLDLVRRAGKSIHPALLALVLAAWIWPIINDMHQGQVNLLVLLLVIAGLWCIQTETPRAEILGALLLALAISIKVTPLAFLAYFLWRRRWRVSATICIALLLWLFAIPSLIFGWTQNTRWLDQWSHIMILPYVEHGQVVYVATQSLPSAVARFLTNTPALTYSLNGVDHGIYVNVLSLSPHDAQWVLRIALLTIGVVGLLWMRRPLTTLKSPRYILETGVLFAFMLWASERTWVHHYVAILLTALAVAMLASDPACARRLKHWCIASLTFLFFAMLSATDIAKIFAGERGSEYARILGLYLAASLLLAALIVIATWKPRPETAIQQGIPGSSL